jgi:hypothetical protein
MLLWVARVIALNQPWAPAGGGGVLVAALIPLAFRPVAAHVPRLAELGIVYLLVAAAASFSQFFNPSRFAMLGAIVAEPDVPRASGHLMSSTYAASIIGPPLAAPLLFTAGVRPVRHDHRRRRPALRGGRPGGHDAAAPGGSAGTGRSL